MAPVKLSACYSSTDEHPKVGDWCLRAHWLTADEALVVNTIGHVLESPHAFTKIAILWLAVKPGIWALYLAGALLWLRDMVSELIRRDSTTNCRPAFPHGWHAIF